VVLPGTPFQVDIQIGITAIEALAILLFANGHFFPIHGNREPALAARTNRDEGAGGFSSNLNTRKESRSLKESRSASAISDSACGKTVPRM
jgi:hypothetical protein